MQKNCQRCGKPCPGEYDMFLGKCLDCFHTHEARKITPKTVFFMTSVDLKPTSHYCEAYQKFLLSIKGAKITDLHLDTRTWGWEASFRIAQEVVLGNWGDLHECDFDWVCIEEIGFGNCGGEEPEAQYFYQWKQVGPPDRFWEGFFEPIDGWPKPLDDYYKEHHLVRRLATIG